MSNAQKHLLGLVRPLPASGVILLMFLAVNTGQAEPIGLSSRVIPLPANAGTTLFVDIDGDGRSDLLVIDLVEKKLLNYHQRPDGFANTPDQVIPLPPHTAWVAACDIDAHPGLELLMSTATGLVYSRQDGGRFEAERRTLLEAAQVFTNGNVPILTSLTTNQAGTNVLIPVISAGQAVLYHRNSAYEWSPEPPLTLAVKQTAWSINNDWWRDPWTLGPHPAHHLRVQQSFGTRPAPKQNQEPDNETMRKILADMKKNADNADASPPMTNRVDVDGDGREDLVLWQVAPGFKTDIYIFLRDADQHLPEKPTQILHCRGIPIPIDSTRDWSPVHDLHGDGICELVLLEFKTSVLSASGLLETALSHGLDWSLTIRSFHRGGFSSGPEASVPVKAVLPAEILSGWPFFIHGDFNGDGRSDFLVRRSDTQWIVFTSTTDGRWFNPEPAMTFETPAHGQIEIKDLNGDGRSDIIWHESDPPGLSVFMSPSPQTKGKNP